MLLTTLEEAFNRNIVASSAARALCARLKDKSLRVCITGLTTDFRVSSSGERIFFARETLAAPADAILSGSALGLLNLLGAQPESALRGGSVRIEGDAEVAQAFRDLLQQARPEFEEELSRYMGDVAAHQTTELLRGATDFGKRAADTLARNVGEYLQEEGRDVAHRIELEEFNAAIDALRNDVARAEARLGLLEQKLARRQRG